VPTTPRASGSAGLPTGPLVLLGVGLGSFVDGILLHQVLQWHHMLSAEESPRTLAGLELNTVADGLFHTFAWVATLCGLLWLVGRIRRGAVLPWRGVAGGLLAGFGLFNVVEGVVDHHLLRVHHVREDVADPLLWDLGFLLLGLALLGLGLALLRSARTSRSSAAPVAAPATDPRPR